MLFDYLSVRILPEKAEGKDFSINIAFTDLEEAYTLSMENSVLNYSREIETKPDVSLILSKKTLDDVQLGQVTLESAVANGDLVIEGDSEVFKDFMGMLDSFKFWFNIVTP